MPVEQFFEGLKKYVAQEKAHENKTALRHLGDAFGYLEQGMERNADQMIAQAQESRQRAKEIESLISVLEEHKSQLLDEFSRRNIPLPSSEPTVQETGEIEFIKPLIRIEKGIGEGVFLAEEKYNTPREILFPDASEFREDNPNSISSRANTCLRRSGIDTVGQILGKSGDELIGIRNFGRRGYDFLIQRLEEQGFLPKPKVDELEREIFRAEEGQSTPFD